MPFIDTESLIREYYDSIKEKYPNLDYDKFEKICKAPFWFIKSNIEKEKTPTIHVKYLGKFIVFSHAIRNLIKRNDDKLKFKNISKEEHDLRDSKYKDKLKEVLHSEQHILEIIEGEN